MKSNQLDIPGTEVKRGPLGKRGKDVIKIAGLTLYSAEKIAEKLNTTRQSVCKQIKNGELKAQKIGGKWYISTNNLDRVFNI